MHVVYIKLVHEGMGALKGKNQNRHSRPGDGNRSQKKGATETTKFNFYMLPPAVPVCSLLSALSQLSTLCTLTLLFSETYFKLGSFDVSFPH
jgi:hypothetical protein